MERIPLKPLLQRTLAIFRQRPFWFILPPLGMGLLNQMPWLTGPQWLKISEYIVLMLFSVPFVWLGIMVAAFPITLTLEIENGGESSLRRAWNRARIQKRLVTTTLAVDFLLLLGILLILALFAGLAAVIVRTHLGSAAIWNVSSFIDSIHAEFGIAIVYLLICRISLAVPLLFVIHPDRVNSYEPLKSSWRLSRGALGPLLLIAFCSTFPSGALNYLAHLAPHSSHFAVAGRWGFQVCALLVSAFTTALTGIALTLIALERGWEPHTTEIFPGSIPLTQPTQQIAIL